MVAKDFQGFGKFVRPGQTVQLEEFVYFWIQQERVEVDPGSPKAIF